METDIKTGVFDLRCRLPDTSKAIVLRTEEYEALARTARAPTLMRNAAPTATGRGERRRNHVLLFLAADSAYKAGQFELAVALYDTAIMLNPRFEEAYGNRAIAKRKLGREAQAEADYATAIALNSRDPLNYYNLANLHADAKRWSAAESLASIAVRLDSTFGRAYVLRGEAAEDGRGAWQQALADYSRASDLSPTDVRTRFFRAMVFFKHNLLLQAERDVDACLALDSTYANGLAMKGRIVQRRGNESAARTLYSAALRYKDRLTCIDEPIVRRWMSEVR